MNIKLNPDGIEVDDVTDEQSRQGGIVVIGAGISGLMAAYLLKQQGFRVTVLEKESYAGGTMRTLCDNGWLIEAGPNSALETTPLFKKVFQELGIPEQVVYANEKANKRYVLRNGELHPLPMNPLAFVKSRLWSWKGKLRLLQEPFIGRADKPANKKAGREETVAEFVERRLGREILDYAINPFVAGVFAGNPEQLSVRAAFPKLYALEEKYGGQIKEMIRGRKERKQRAEKAKDRAKLFSFIEGMQTFPHALAVKLGESLKLNCSVERIMPQKNKDKNVYEIEYHNKGIPSRIEADILILSTPAYVAAKMIESIDTDIASLLESIYYPPVAEVFMGVKQEQVGRALDGFGFLIPEKEQRTILGTIWSSAIFPNRAPRGHVALTTFVGGARQPALAHHTDNELRQMIMQELRSLLRTDGSPVYVKITRWEKAIPQYQPGYETILQRIDQFESEYPGIYFCSNFRGGISVGDCVMSAERLARRILLHDPVVSQTSSHY